MNPIQSILVHLDAGPHGAARLRVARNLAGQFGATATALYAVTPLYVQMASDIVVGSAADSLIALDAERMTAARKLVTAANAEPGAQLQWSEAQEAPEFAFVRQALYADLLVLGQHDRQHRETGVLPDFVQSVVLHSGKPALVVPYIGPRNASFDTVFVAWKESRESAHAVTAALPLLRLAKAVHVGVDAEVADKTAVQQFLRRHGVDAKCHTLATQTSEAGELMLSMAADFGADLMVMGLYGHSRARELVLGGASRTVLESMTLPVLLTH
ncbi:MAG TPA: universal stress protein [Burkholderiaceae bacterium]|nr:universal stress protein [Burkholderiaceae bacterium]